MGKKLGLDIGHVRIGIAVSDSMGVIAMPLESYTRSKGDVEFDCKYITEIATSNNIEAFVCGLPVGMAGNETIQTELTRQFCEQLGEYSGLPIIYADERLSSVTAENILIEGNVRRENRKKMVDKIAASVILQSYLDYHS